MKIAIGFSDQITTVSEKYAEEILIENIVLV